MVACTHDELPESPHEGEHPVVAIVAEIAMIAAMLLITWARLEVHGTRDIEAALTEDGPIEAKAEEDRELDAAVTSNRFATGVSPQ